MQKNCYFNKRDVEISEELRACEQGSAEIYNMQLAQLTTKLPYLKTKSRGLPRLLQLKRTCPLALLQ